MNLRLSIQSSWRLLKVLLCAPLWIPVVLVSACALPGGLESAPAVDLSLVREGVARQEIGAVVGQPKREWVTHAGVHYCLYLDGRETKQRLIAVSYDTQGIVIGVFKDVGEFDSFPEDGRVPKPARGAIGVNQ